MALVVFGERIDFNSINLPEEGGYVVGYDILTDLLSQMDYLGNVTVIGTVGGGAPLSTTLSLGNTTGTYSILLDSSLTNGTNKLTLDNMAILLSTDGSFNESYLYMNAENSILGNGISKSFRIESTGITVKWSDLDKQTITTNSYELFLNNLNTLQFGKLSSGPGSKLSALISTDNSTIVNNLINTVVIGGQNIQALQSNSVYVPFLLIQDGKNIKGTKGQGQLLFTEYNDTILSNNNSIIGNVSSTSSTIFTQNGIFLKDSATASTSVNFDTGITYISSRNSSATASIKNSVIIGGQNLVATADNTVYLGNTVNINNSFSLPTTDGLIDQVLKTNGLGIVSWGNVSATLNKITLTYNAFLLLNSVFAPDTLYIITNADIDLYGGTEIYLTTNSDGVLSDEGIGEFYNPNYNQNIAGNNIFSATQSYAINSLVIWGGYVWQNTTGVTGTASSLFTLNVNFTKKAFNLDDYTISYDKIKYDWQNNLIIYRNEKNINYVSSNKGNIDYWKSLTGHSPIKVFQWGNLFNFTTNKGIGNQNIINSYNENINFRGALQNYIVMNNLSAQYNLTTSTAVRQSNIQFDNYIFNRQSTLLVDETNLVFQGNLPTITASKILGKINNQQVEIDITPTQLVTPLITNRWSIFNFNNTPFNSTLIDNITLGTFSLSNSILVPNGCKVSIVATSSIPAASLGFSTPTLVTGSFSFNSVQYPVVSATLSFTGITMSTDFPLILSKPKTGLTILNQQIVSATGSDTLSLVARVIFSDIFYYGYANFGPVSANISQVTVDSITASQIQNLNNYKFGGKAQTFIANDGGAGSRLIFAYPSSLGLLTALTYTESTINSLGAFTKTTNPLNITTISGANILYHVYIANADNTWGNSTNVTITTI